jgi:ANTAR domain
MTGDTGPGSLSAHEQRSTTDIDPGSRESLGEAIARLQTTNENLQRALYSRILIEQAKGVLAERYSLSIDAAFDLLRYGARATRTNIHEFAGGIIRLERQQTEAIVAALATPERWQRPRLPDLSADLRVGSSLEAGSSEQTDLPRAAGR